ncbi:MAG: bifunctional 5,10-methylenetetrahydrofolate dehydrogenase/5,10-methenyltetrahydrofolate cyclohydrolase [Candidatus Omnitrophica bacterium]|nr:bifunctional 5,10-methylenetetrahydrofolate dehydrogenase/5,10-methenyltetrahydrofolate cyclohydrolase [Candidatus Omnitrophota bacterium]
MSAKILDGKALSLKLQAGLKAEVERLKMETGKTPRFMNIVIGSDPGAASYGKSQKKVADNIGVDYQFSHLQQHVTQKELIDHIRFLNEDPAVHGIMLHKPVPEGIDFKEAVNEISFHKDLEGMTLMNLGQLFLNRTKIIPCTAAGAMALLESSGVNLAGKNALVVGRSEIVGKPMMLLLLEKNATVTVCHSATTKANRLVEEVKRAEILVVAMERAGFIKGEWVREGAIVIDVGINEDAQGKIVGDVEFDEAAKRASFITPVPGGVGPVTAVCLMKNGIEMFKQFVGKV